MEFSKSLDQPVLTDSHSRLTFRRMSELFLDEQSDNFIFLINLIKVNNYIIT